MTNNSLQKSETTNWIIAAIILFGGLYFIFGRTDDVVVAAPEVQQVEVLQDALDPNSINEQDRLFICRATIAAIMNRPMPIIKATTFQTESVRVHYVRDSDNSYWAFLCKTSGDKILWASIREDGVVGRWRDNPEDEQITFALNHEEVLITQRLNESSVIQKKFSRD